MKDVLKIVSLIFAFIGLSIFVFIKTSISRSVVIERKIIDNISMYESDDYLGYIYIPNFDLKKIIKKGTSSSILDGGYVGMYDASSDLLSNDMIVLAGHNVSNVFSKLHFINIGDCVYINSHSTSRKFVVYDKKIVNEHDVSYLNSNKLNELLLITCTKRKGERLLVFLKEEI